MTEQFILTGSFRDVGKELGKITKEAVKKNLEDFKKSALYTKVMEYMETDDGSALLATLKNTVETYCSNYVDGLRGIAQGAGVDFEDLLLYNFDCEFGAAVALYPEGSHGVSYATMYDGCTNISMEIKDSQVYLAHTEDIAPVAKDLGVMITVEVIQDGQIVESWTDYHVPGMLSGSKFSFNSHGMMCGANNILQKGINRNGIPRKFMCRSMMCVRDTDHAVQILQKSPGIATAYSLHYVQKTKDGVENTVIEVAGTPSGSKVAVYKPRGYYHHCNMFQHLSYECHPEESSVHRAAVLSQYVNRGQTQTKKDLLSAISNRQDTKFPVHRNGARPDYLATGATGIFDISAGVLEVYSDVPENSQPSFVFKIPGL